MFGVHQHAPQTRFDTMGLVPLQDGSQVIALTEKGASSSPEEAHVRLPTAINRW